MTSSLKLFLILYYIKQIDSKLPCVCSVIDHRGRQNVVRTSVIHSAAPCMPLFCSYHLLTSSVVYYWTDARQLGINLELKHSLEICMGEGSFKARVFFSKYCPLMAKCIIFRVYTTVIYLKWEEYKLRILKIGWFLKTVWMKSQTSI